MNASGRTLFAASSATTIWYPSAFAWITASSAELSCDQHFYFATTDKVSHSFVSPEMFGSLKYLNGGRTYVPLFPCAKQARRCGLLLLLSAASVRLKQLCKAILVCRYHREPGYGIGAPNAAATDVTPWCAGHPIRRSLPEARCYLRKVSFNPLYFGRLLWSGKQQSAAWPGHVVDLK